MPRSQATETAVLHANFEMVSREEPSYFDEVFFLLLVAVGGAIILVRTSCTCHWNCEKLAGLWMAG